LIYEASEFVFHAPAPVARARRILIKPSASSTARYPQNTSAVLLKKIISGIRQVSTADILLLEGASDGSPMQPVYRALGYEFPRVLSLDVRDCTWVEVDNPLEKPYAVPTFWIPNVILSSDFLISVAPLKVNDGRTGMSITNLLSVLPREKYGRDHEILMNLGPDRVIADLYFTLPFDLGIIEAECIYHSPENGSLGQVEDCGHTFIGDPYQVDLEASCLSELPAQYLSLIDTAREEFDM
jgi:hypothetical protein